jgi:endonuclease YncB( thermonuclease family)
MSTGVFKLVDGETVELTAEENNQRLAKIEATEAEYASTAWLRGRLQEYGDLASQLDEQFHDFDAWKARIQAVKNKYPKPE